jgi:hypothetical protein
LSDFNAIDFIPGARLPPPPHGGNSADWRAVMKPPAINNRPGGSESRRT